MRPPPPVDHNAIRVALVHAVMDATGLDQNHVIMAEPEVPNTPRTSLPYITLKTTTAGMRYGDDTPQPIPGVPSMFTFGGPRLLVVSFNAYGTSHDEAYELMATWQAALGAEPTIVRLQAQGIAVWLPGPIVDLSALLETAYEGRAQMDCRFGVASNMQADLGQIDTVNVDGAVSSADATVPVDAVQSTLEG